MSRIGGGVVLLVLGAILAFAVQDSISQVDLTAVGYILMVGGAVLLLLSLVMEGRSRRITSQATTARPGEDPVVTRREVRDNGL